MSNLLLSYDFNHQNGTHPELFEIKANKILSFEHDGNYAKFEQELVRDENTFTEVMNNPSLQFMPKTFKNYLEYSYLSTTAFLAKVPTDNLWKYIYILKLKTERKLLSLPMLNSRTHF